MTEFSCCKLEIFIPESHLPVLQQALREADAGHIGSYDSCLSYSPVTSCWRPLTGSEPYLGQVGALSTEPELKVEVTCRREKLDETLRAVKAVHLYEEPVINVIRTRPGDCCGSLWGARWSPERARNRPWCGSAGRNWQLKWQWVISFWRSLIHIPTLQFTLRCFTPPLSKGCPRSWSTTISATLRWMRFLNMSSARRMK